LAALDLQGNCDSLATIDLQGNSDFLEGQPPSKSILAIKIIIITVINIF
jgi:hypothetical protein